MEELYEQAMTLVERHVNLISQTPGQGDALNHMLKEMEAYCKSEQVCTSAISVTDRYVSILKEAKTTEESAEIMNKYEEDLKKLDQINGNKHARYISLKSKVSAFVDDEIQTVMAPRQVIDPVTKQRMIDPVKNKGCGHSYEKSSVLTLIEMNPKTRCPIGGCTTYLRKKDLVPDIELKRYLVNTMGESVHDESVEGIFLEETVLEEK